MSGVIVVRRGAGVLRLMIDRPDRSNALTPELAAELGVAFDAVPDDRDLRVVLLRGAGDRAFCGGFDLGRLEGGDRGSGLRELLETIERCPVPVVAVLNGHAIGAGLELACACDLRIARAGAFVGLPAVRLGVAYRAEGLRRIVSRAPAARRLLLTGEQVPVEEVPGLADAVVSKQRLDDEADAWAEALCAGAPRALSYTIAVLRSNARGETMAFEAERAAIMAGPDIDEAIAARKEGREPRFLPRDVPQT